MARTKGSESKTIVKKTKKVNTQKVLFVSGEAAPFIRSGGLGDVAGALPKALKAVDVETRVILPLYSEIPVKYTQTMKFLGSSYVHLGWRNQYLGIFETTANGITYYFIDNEYYFKRRGLYGHYDDAERFTFFCKAVLETLLVIDFEPDIIHCNDWHTALVPVFLDVFYRSCEKLRRVKTLFTIHNIEFQGKFDMSLASDICGLPYDKLSLVEYSGCTNFMKGAIECSNAVNTVSPTYSKEILEPFYSYGLESILHDREYKLSGILNGLDTEVYDPETDTSLFCNYNLDSVQNKKINKEAVCRMLNLTYDENKPMLSIVSRLTTQKGLDLILQVAEELLSGDIQLVILGSGDWKFENALKNLETRYGAKLRVIIQFSKDLASKLYGASDIFLMPSRFEPCGLSQMIAMRYGAVPVVRETGGLKDSVKQFDAKTGTGTGFVFKEYNANEMLTVIWNAIDTYNNDKETWNKIVANAMTEKLDWSKSALQYKKLYEKIISQ